MILNMDVKISVIIPVYNVEKYLNRTLQSIVNQSFDSYEVILINDGSTDKSLSIINDFLDQFDYFYLVNQENSGQSHARNAGLKKANGEYIYFFDSDDLLSSDALEKMYRNITNQNLDILLFSGDSFSDNASINSNAFSYSKTKDLHKVSDGDTIFLKLLENGEYTPSPCLYITKKSVLIDNNITFFENIIHEDILFTYNVLLSSNKAMIIDDILFHRRIRANSTMSSDNYGEKIKGLLTVFFEINKVINSENNSKQKKINSYILSGVFGNIIRNFSMLKKRERPLFQPKIGTSKKVSKEYDFFRRKDYALFYYSETLYILFRRMYDKIYKN